MTPRLFIATAKASDLEFVEQEGKDIVDLLGNGGACDVVTPANDLTLREFSRALQHGAFNVVHYAGHAGEGSLHFDEGRAYARGLVDSLRERDTMVRRKRKCSFCGQSEVEVSKLLAGPKVHICGGCVKLCNDILAADGTPPSSRIGDLSDDDLMSTLKPTVAAIDALNEMVRERVDELRRREISWVKIGGALGVSRQAAWERFS